MLGLGAHPRVCGADVSAAFWMAREMGSSPRVRGRPRVGDREKLLHGLIPACAGQTADFRSAHCGAWAHPRVCGADGRHPFAEPHFNGSSPRVRGRQLDGKRVAHALGLIPACAGQTTECADNESFGRAHPRVCGADRRHLIRSSRRVGSSPRVRGRPHPTCLPSVSQRLIPACAGQTSAPACQ